MSAHTGIRLRVDVPGAGTILLADSDWLHLNALMRELDSAGKSISDVLLAEAGQSFQPGEGWVSTGDGSVGPWHSSPCGCSCANCSGCTA